MATTSARIAERKRLQLEGCSSGAPSASKPFVRTAFLATLVMGVQLGIAVGVFTSMALLVLRQAGGHVACPTRDVT